MRSNTKEFNGRVFVLVLDDLQTHFARSVRVRAAAKLFIERYLGANDIAAIVETGARKDGAQDFTSNRTLLLKAVNNFAGQKLRRHPVLNNPTVLIVVDRRAWETRRMRVRARNTLATLRQVADYLAGVRGRRKAVVPAARGSTTTSATRYRTATPPGSATMMSIAAPRANVSFYGIDPRGLTTLGGEGLTASRCRTIRLGLAWHRSATSSAARRMPARDFGRDGGFAAMNRNDFREAFHKIIRTTAATPPRLLLDDTQRDGRFRNVQVRVKRPGLTVRARKGFVAPKGKHRRRLLNKATSASLRRRSRRFQSALGLSVFLAPLKGVAPNIDCSLEVRDPGSPCPGERPVRGRHRGQRWRWIATTPKSRMAAGTWCSWAAATHDIVARSGVRIARRLELPPGRYQPRRRPRRRHRFGSSPRSAIPDFSKDPCDERPAGVVRFREPVPSVNPDPDFKAVLPPPSALREFPRNDTLALFGEVCDDQLKTPHRVAIKTSIIADDGKVVHRGGRAQERGVTGRKGRLRLHHHDRHEDAGARPLRAPCRSDDALTDGGLAKANRVLHPVMEDIETIAR